MKKTILLITLLLLAVFCCVNAEDVVTFFTNNIRSANTGNPEYSDTEVSKETVGNHEFDYGTDW